MTSIMWPTRSRVSHSVHRVCTFQFFGSETRRMKFARSLRMTLMTVSLPSADIGLTGAITAVLIRSFPSQRRNCDHARNVDESVPRARRRRGRYDDGRKGLIEGLAADIEPGRQAQRRTESLERFVDREAGPI